MQLRSLAFTLLLMPLLAQAQIYKYTDANGNTAYTNQPPDHAPSESVDLPPLNTVSKPSPAPNMDRMPQRDKKTGQVAEYQVLELTDLPTDDALRANNGSFIVKVMAEPRLKMTDAFRLVVDGQPYGQTSNVPSLQVVNLDRGTHTFAVQVLRAGQLIQQSPTITLTIQRVHVKP